ncbi:hypothetical protein FGIG_05582 [Fasciola gigantica]|uniref:Uncharacterized protein n=1 Tax=Fasciola gigantica TaxID=46835 RepID=A0A504YS47_FASGI|nr:hypothetical protein FGIG_05582 [Fasciola gigantica]
MLSSLSPQYNTWSSRYPQTHVIRLQYTGKPSFLAVFAEYFPPHSKREKLHRWAFLQRLFGHTKRPNRLHLNPGIHLTYQDKLRVNKRGPYDCTDIDTFNVFAADQRVSASKPATPPVSELFLCADQTMHY